MPARLQLRREGWKRHEQSGWAEETSQEAEKWLKAERQYQTAEQNGSQVADQMLVPVKMKQQQQRNQRQKYLHKQQLRIQRRMSKDEQGLNVKPCS